MSSLLEREKEREKKRAEGLDREGGLLGPGPSREFLGKDPGRPRADAWYVKMMVKRIVAFPCEPRELALKTFRELWPALADRAEEFYDTAVRMMEEEA